MKNPVVSAMALLFAMAIAVPVFGHGNKKHVMGTLEKIEPTAVVVKTRDGKSVEVKLADSTMYVDKAGKPAKFADLAVGQRVVIHATPKGTELIAAEVKFGAAAAPPGNTPAGH